MTTAPFPNRPRVDAREKVTGRLKYAADVAVEGLLYGMMVPSTIARGRVVEVATDAALAVPGVVRVLTAADCPAPPAPGPGGPPPPAMIVDRISYRGEPVALVVAESHEAAVEGMEAVRVRYEAADFSPLIDSEGGEREPVEDVTAGNADGALAGAVTRLSGEYVSPNQHHNPIEMLSTTAVWEDGRLQVYEGTQGSNMVKGAIVGNLRLDPAKVVVSSPSVGGGFGQKGFAQRQTSLAALAAVLIGRPVKIVVPRSQIFHNATYRPRSRHRIELGADAAGKMVAIRYDADHQQSRRGQFAPSYHESSTQMYGVENYLGTAANIRIDTQAPGYMRAPHPHPQAFALESAVDELALKLGVDPVEFRLRHDTTTDPIHNKPLSSRHLNECIREGARRFGWQGRPLAPAAMVLEDGTQLGWGMASGAYPVLTHPAEATLRVSADGTTRFSATAHEMGQGIRSTLEQVLIRSLDIDSRKLEIRIGDTSVAAQHVTAGSWGTASGATAAGEAATALKARMVELLDGRSVSGNLHQQLAAVRRPFVEVEISRVAPGQGARDLATLRAGGMALTGPVYPEFTSFSYVAHFVEVRVEPRTRRIRVPRVVSVADCGRVVSPRTAESQMRGGVIWGISAALREETEVDPRYGGWLNNDLADYVVAVNADIGEIEVGLIDRPDTLINALGAKGLGEVAMVGVAGAVANAVFHATGVRVRKMPLRIEDLL